MQKYSPRFHRTIKLPPAIGDWTTIHQRDAVASLDIQPIRTSNFDSLTKEQLRFLHYLHYRLAERLCLKFSVDMDIKVELHTVLATQMSYQEFLQHATEKVVQADIALDHGHKLNVMFEWQLADMMVNRLVGGGGQVGPTETFTTLETGILKAQLQAILPEIAAVWHMDIPEDAPIDFSVGSCQPNLKISSRDAYVQFAFYLIFGQQDLRKCVIAYPNALLRRLVQHWYRVHPKSERKVFLAPQTLARMKVGVQVSLGTALLTMSELQLLQVGDVIVLDTLTTKPLRVSLGIETECWGVPGISQNRKLAVQLQGKETVAVRAPVAASPDPVVSRESSRESSREPESGPPFVGVEDVTDSMAYVVPAAMTPETPAYTPEVGFSEHEFDIEDGAYSSEDVSDNTGHDDVEDQFDFSDAEEEKAGSAEPVDDGEFSWDDLDDEL